MKTQSSNPSLTSWNSFREQTSKILGGDSSSQKINAHVVLGSGFGLALADLNQKTYQHLGTLRFGQIADLATTTVQDHSGSFQFYRHKDSGQAICFQVGRLHGYEGHSPAHVVAPVMLTRAWGCENFILTNAAGGLLEGMTPGCVMLIEDHINLTGKNPLIGGNPVSPIASQDFAAWGPRFPDLTHLWQPNWQPNWKSTLTALLQKKLPVFHGVYVGVLGPSFETSAEVKLFAKWGMGAVGMSTVWEAISLRHSGAQIAGLSLISNLGAGLSEQSLDHETILQTSRKSAAHIVQSIAEGISQCLLAK